MKGKFSLYVCAFCFLIPMYFTISSSFYSTGSWCPYQVEKVIPCRVRNGTEPYYGTNICWRNENGSYACTKKLMYRAKYITTYKKVRETKYKCCPGRDGPECENECFNCTTLRKLEERIAAQNRKLGRMEKSLLLQKSTTNGIGTDRFHRDFSSENSVYSAATPPALHGISQERERNSEGTSDSSLSLAYATLNLRVQTILDEFREMQNRIRYLENEVSRLNTQVDDLSLGSNIAYDYSSGSSSSSSLHRNKDSRTHPAIVNSNNKDGSHNEMTNDEGNTANGRRSSESNDRTITTSRYDHETHHHRHPHNRHHQQQQNYHQELTPPSHPHLNHNHRSSSTVKSDSITPFRVLEENLERGDIASTLNDDYGDELYNDNSTEQYIDQLATKREQHSP